MTDTTKTDAVSQLAKAIHQDPELVRAVNLPEGRLIDMFEKAQKIKKIGKLTLLPGVLMILVAMLTPADEKKEPLRWGALGLGYAIVIGGFFAAGKNNPAREFAEARDARLIELSKQNNAPKP